MRRKPKTFHLMLIEHKGVRMFHHLATGRAALEIEFHRVPWSSTVELFRGTKSLATAIATSYGTHAPLEAFHGRPPLINKSPHLPAGWSDEIKAASRSLRLGDQIVLVLEPGSLPYSDKESALEVVFHKATYASKEAALREHNQRNVADAALTELRRLMPNDETRYDFLRKYAKKTWLQILQLVPVRNTCTPILACTNDF